MIPYDNLTEDTFQLQEVEQPYLSGIKNNKPQFYLGLSRWTYKEEEKKKSSSFPQPGTLTFYSQYFNSIELDATHYDIPNADKCDMWYKAAKNNDFRFCPKFHKSISHEGVVDVHKFGVTKGFMQTIMNLKEKLGTSFLQLKEEYSIDTKDKLINYLKLIPTSFNLSIELRHPDWFQNRDSFNSFVKDLNSLGKGLVITDSPGRRDAVHMKLSNSTAFIRFNCQGDHELDLFRIDEWRKRLRSLYLQGLQQCYFFLHIHNKEYEDDFIKYVQHELKF